MAEAYTALAGLSELNRMDALQDALSALSPPQSQAPEKSFSLILSEGLEAVSKKVSHANEMVRDFAVDENIPIHQVTIALEDARMSMELAAQIRQRLLEGYQTIMNMQL